MANRFRAARIALVVAPLLALGACDQINAWISQVQGGDPAAAPKLSEVAPEFRSIGGAVVRPEAAMPEMLVVERPEFVVGEVLIGARVRDQVRGAAQSLGIAMARGVTPDQLLEMNPQVLVEAVEDAVDEAKRDVTTVLNRLRITEAEILPDESGFIKIDLRGPSPTRYQSPSEQAANSDAQPAAAPPTLGTPQNPVAGDGVVETVEDTGQTCPRTVTPAQLDADMALKTICTYQRLRDSGQFQFVEKNYVVQVDRMEWFSPPRSQPPKQTTPAPTTPGASTAPDSSGEQVATGALPNDPLLSLQWHYRGPGAGPNQSPGGAGFEPYWQTARNVGSRAVRVAVIDTGIETSHPDVRGNPNILPGIDLVTDFDRGNDGDGVDRDANDPGDACRPGLENSFHGTHVAGTIGAALTNDRKGVASAAWNVSVIPVRALGKCGGELEDIISAIRWAAGLAPAVLESGDRVINPTPADIINMSLSVPIPCPQSMQAAINDANRRGSVIVVAAGNKGNPVANFAPANCQGVVVVAAGDARGNLAFYSNFGPEISIIAPGGDVFADSDNDGRPDGVLSIRTTTDNCFDPETKQAAPRCNYGYLQGTSMAAPHVAAALALLQRQFNVKGDQLRQTLLTRAMAPIDPNTVCSVRCDRNPNATERIPGQSGLCLRRCGGGRLDMTRAAPSAAPAGGG